MLPKNICSESNVRELFSRGQDDKNLRLCGKYSSLQLEGKQVAIDYVSEWAWLSLNKTLFTKIKCCWARFGL